MLMNPTSEEIARQVEASLQQSLLDKRVQEERSKAPFFSQEGRVIYDPALATIQQIYDRVASDMSTATDTKKLMEIAGDAIKDAMFFRQRFDLAITELLRLGIRTQEHFQTGMTNYAGRL